MAEDLTPAGEEPTVDEPRADGPAGDEPTSAMAPTAAAGSGADMTVALPAAAPYVAGGGDGISDALAALRDGDPAAIAERDRRRRAVLVLVSVILLGAIGALIGVEASSSGGANHRADSPGRPATSPAGDTGTPTTVADCGAAPCVTSPSPSSTGNSGAATTTSAPPVTTTAPPATGSTGAVGNTGSPGGTGTTGSTGVTGVGAAACSANPPSFVLSSDNPAWSAPPGGTFEFVVAQTNGSRAASCDDGATLTVFQQVFIKGGPYYSKDIVCSGPWDAVCNATAPQKCEGYEYGGYVTELDGTNYDTGDFKVDVIGCQ